MQCAIINHQICQRLNSPTTQNAMLQIIDHYSSRILTKRNSNDSQKSATQYENKVSKLSKECDEDTEIQMDKKHAKV